MTDRLFSKDMKRFEEAFAEWTARPPRTPATDAARRVLARATSAALPLPWARLVAAAVFVTLIVVTAWFSSGVVPRPRAVVVADLAPAPLPDNVLLWYLDPQMPVYLVLSPLGSRHGGVS